jgi:hypothetical protein
MFDCPVPGGYRDYPGKPYCYCSDDTCSKGADETCAPTFQAVARSTDDAEVLRQLKDSTTTLYHVARYLYWASCTEMCLNELTLNPNTAKGFQVNEINHIQGGADPAEFIEIFNGTGWSIDFTGKDLRGYAGRARVLTVPLDGVLPNDGFLVISNGSVPVPVGTKRIDLPAGVSIPHTRFITEVLATGAPDPNPIPDDYVYTPFKTTDPDGLAGSDQSGTACLVPDGDIEFGGFINHCATPTPGARNVR